MDLPKGQDELIEAVAAVNKRTVVVVVAGAPVTMTRWIDRVPAVLYAWYGGQELGYGSDLDVFFVFDPDQAPEGVEAIDKYVRIDAIVPGIRRELDYTIDEKARTVVLTEEGVHTVEKRLNVENLYEPDAIEILHHVRCHCKRPAFAYGQRRPFDAERRQFCAQQ